MLAQRRDEPLIDWTRDHADQRTKCNALIPARRKAAALFVAKSVKIEQTILADLPLHEPEITRRTREKVSQRFDLLGR